MRTSRQVANALGIGAPSEPLDVTIVLPAYNEESTVEGTFEELSAVMRPTGLTFELLYVDDGSTDGTWTAIRRLCEREDCVHALRHRANSGKASALATGFAHARGDIVALCDVDLQYDPNDVVRVINKVREGYDAVTANKVVRRDPLSKRLPSKFFNYFLRETTGIRLHDMNAGLKAFRREAAQELIRYGYGGLHRFFMVVVAKKGFSVAEVAVESRPRVNGHSKYGAERYLRGAMDFLTVFFLSGYMERPLNLFGGMAVLFGMLGTVVMVSSFALALLKHPALAGPLMGVGALMLITGTQLLVVGLIAEMINNLEHGTLTKGKIAEVIGVDRRIGKALDECTVVVERRRDVLPHVVEGDVEQEPA